jgi:hypothetical protein
MAVPVTEPNLYHPGSGQEFSRDPESTTSKIASPSELANQEASAPNYTPGSGADDLNFTGNNNEKPKKLSKVASKLGNLKKKKWLLMGGFGGGFGIIGLIVLLFFAASVLKVPALGTYIVQQQFARLSRQFASDADRVTEEELAIDASDAAVRDGLQAADKDLPDNIWGKLDQSSPSTEIQNLDLENGIKPSYSQNGQILDGIDINGQELPVEPQTSLEGFNPEVKQIINFGDKAALENDFVPALEDSLDANVVGPIIRSSVASDIRQQLGIDLEAWTLGSFLGKTPSDAQVAVDQAAFNAESETSTPQPADEAVSGFESTEAQAAAEAKTDASIPQVVKTIEADNGVDQNVVNIFKSVVTNDAMQKVIGFINPLYSIALPMCIIYDGSMDQSGPTINNETQAQEKAFYFLAAGGDEQKAGGPSGDSTGTAEATAVGAMNTKLGDISQSNPYIQASGGTVDTSTTALSAESSADGEYTLLNATLPQPVAQAVNGSADKICSAITNLWFAAGTGLAALAAQTLAGIFSGGGSAAATAAGEEAIDTAVDDAASAVAEEAVNDVLSTTVQKTGSTATRVLAKAWSVIKSIPGVGTKTALQLGGVTVLTVVARVFVMEKSDAAGLYNGLEQGTDYANEADSGANIQAGELERQQLFGRPLTCAEITQNDQSDQQFIADQNQSQSITDRYLALSNPNSLVSHMASMIYTDTNGSLLSPLGSFVANFISGPAGFGSWLGSLFGVAHADPSCASEDYGNVQFGWSQAEESLIDSNPNSYQPLENAKTFEDELNSMGKTLGETGEQVEGDMATMYGACFGYQYNPNGNGNFDPTDPNGDLQSDITGNGSLGTLLSTSSPKPYIVRDSTTEISPNQGVCSPQNLGINNPTYGDLVFRWRLAMSYDTTVDQLSSLQTVTN